MDVDGFDRWAPRYDSGALQTLLYHPMHHSILNHVAVLRPEPARVLDLGCGSGQLLRAASCRFPDAVLVGVDPCGPMLDAAATNASCSRLVRARAEELPFPDGTFDVITCTATVRHWNNMKAGLAEAARVLSSAGVLALADFFAPRSRSRWKFASRRHSLPPPLQSALGGGGLRTLTVRIVDGYGPVPDVTVALAAKDIVHGRQRPLRFFTNA